MFKYYFLILFAVEACIYCQAFLRISKCNRILSISAKNKLDGIIIEGDLQPLSNNIFVKVKEVQTATSGGIYIPDNAKEKPTEGTVIATGPGRVHPETALQLDMAVKVGDSVLYGKYDGSEMKYNDENHQLIKDDDVLLKYSGRDITLANCEPVKDQVLIKLPPKESANMAGIIITTPTTTDKRPDTGEVVKVGPGRQAGNGKIMSIQVKPGEQCRFREFAGAEVKIEGKDYVVIRAYDILAKW